MNLDGSAANYLLDLGALVRDLALKAKADYEDKRDSDDAQYLLGRLGALHEVVSLMQQQANAFGLPQDAVSMKGIDPDRDLL